MVSDDDDPHAYKARLRAALGLHVDDKVPPELASEVAKVGKISYQAAMKVLAWEGKSKAFSACVNSLVAAHLRIDPDWLATGQGHMRSEKVWPFPAVQPADFFDLPESLRQEVEDRLEGAVHRMQRLSPPEPKSPNGRTGTHDH